MQNTKKFQLGTHGMMDVHLTYVNVCKLNIHVVYLRIIQRWMSTISQKKNNWKKRKNNKELKIARLAFLSIQ